jgi:TRAP-type mannitol/chloroaromatic compound transport system permease small subunit
MDYDKSIAMKLFGLIESSVWKTGRIFAWLNGILIVVIIVQVILRYVFGKGFVILEELQWHLYSAAMLWGLSYAEVKNTHIRLDLIYVKLSERKRASVDLLGTAFLLLPFVFIVFFHGIDFASHSWRVRETSDAPMGLPCLYVIKSFIPICFGLLGLSAISKCIQYLKVISASKP